MLLLTGGSGTLGRELKKLLPPCWSPSHKLLDITKFDLFDTAVHWSEIDLIVHCAAYVDVAGAEKNKQLAYDTNVLGTRNLASLGIPMLYISTEYVFDGEKGNYAETDYPNPVNFYGLTKLLGEYEARRTRAVILRCLFKARPFKHENAFVDQFTSGDYVERVAKDIALACQHFDSLPGVVHVGFGKKSVFELARQSRICVGKRYRKDVDVRIPRDTSLNTTLWEKIKHDIRPTR